MRKEFQAAAEGLAGYFMALEIHPNSEYLQNQVKGYCECVKAIWGYHSKMEIIEEAEKIVREWIENE